MTLEITPKDTVDIYETPIVLQTAFWSQVKQQLGVRSRAFDFKVRNRDLYIDVGGYSYTQADVILFMQQLNRQDYIAYFPYGPEVEPSEENQGLFLEELSESLRSYLPEGCIALRYDLNWQSHWCGDDYFDENGLWTGEPDKFVQEFRLNYSTFKQNLRKANNNILPANTIVLDLTHNEDMLLLKMKPKTRYNIKLALRKGVKVCSMGIEGLGIWYKLYCDTAIRNGLHMNSEQYFQSIFASCMKNTDDVKVRLLVAYADELPLAAMFLVMSRCRATYLYGASSSENRNFMATYALQWEAIKIAKANACTEYDFFGIAPSPDPSHPMYGLYKFKHGFGGEIFHQMGCWDYPLDEDKYFAFQAREIQSKGYYQ